MRKSRAAIQLCGGGGRGGGWVDRRRSPGAGTTGTGTFCPNGPEAGTDAQRSLVVTNRSLSPFSSAPRQARSTSRAMNRR